MMTKERIKYFDALKLFAIFLVLWGHAVQQFSCGGGSGYGYENPVFRAIYAFHMPLFMGVVGYFASSLAQLSFKEMWVKKFRQLILPALSFGVIYSLLAKYIMGGGRWLSGWSWFWFLKSAFVCCILYWLGTRWKTHKLAGLSMTVVASFFYGDLVSHLPTVTGAELISVWHVPKLYLCFVIGALIRTYQKVIIRHEGLILTVVALVWIPMWILMIPDQRYHYFPYTHILSHGTALFGLVEAGLSVVFFILLFKMLSQHVPSTKLGTKMCEWGGMTLSIYCLQVFILETYMPTCLDFKWMNQWVFDLIAAPLISVAVLLVCVMATRLMQRSRWLSWLFLGKELQPRRNKCAFL